MAEPNSARSTAAGRTGPTSTSATASGGSSRASESHENWLLGRVRDSATAGIESQKRRATEGLGSIAQAVRTTTDGLRKQQHESLAEYVEQAADQIDRFSQQLKNKDVREIVDDAQRLARRNPAAFAGTAFALGLVTARFLKSSNDADGGYRDYDDDRGQDRWTSEPWRSGESHASARSSSDYTPPHGDAALGTSAAAAGERASRTSSSAAGTPATSSTGEQQSARSTANRAGGETERS